MPCCASGGTPSRTRDRSLGIGASADLSASCNGATDLRTAVLHGPACNSGSRLASSVMRGYMGTMQPDGGMPELLKREIDRLETAIDLSTDWLEIQYLMVELDQLKALYEEEESEAA